MCGVDNNKSVYDLIVKYLIFCKSVPDRAGVHAIATNAERLHASRWGSSGWTSQTITTRRTPSCSMTSKETFSWTLRTGCRSAPSETPTKPGSLLTLTQTSPKHYKTAHLKLGELGGGVYLGWPRSLGCETLAHVCCVCGCVWCIVYTWVKSMEVHRMCVCCVHACQVLMKPSEPGMYGYIVLREGPGTCFTPTGVLSIQLSVFNNHAVSNCCQ